MFRQKNSFSALNAAASREERRCGWDGSTGSLTMYSTTGPNDGTGLELWAPNNPTFAGQVHLLCYGDGTGEGFGFGRGYPSYRNYMSINKDGKVVIAGPGMNVEDLTTPGNYGLYVGNGIMTEHVHVAVHTTSYWADYVFAKDYKLMPLNKVAEYVKENKHLPDVPSADEVVKDGLDLGSMDAKLLKKVEELTLYAIQQQKEIDELKNEIKKIKQ